MSVAQKDGIKAADGISYDDLYRRWEQSNWQATAIDFSDDRDGWDGLTDIQRRSALWIYSMFLYGEDSVTDNLSPYIDAAPQHRAEVLPRHPAGRRGPPRRLLPPLLQGGDRRRRLDLLDPRLHARPSSAGATATSSTASTGWPTTCAATARCRTSPARSRCTTWSSRRRSPSPGSTSSRTTSPTPGRCPASARGWRTSPATSSATSASASRCSRSASRSRRSASRRSPSCCARCCPTRSPSSRRRLGPRVHALLRLRARGHLRVRAALGADQVAGDRLPDRGDARRAAGRSGARRRRRSHGARSSCCEAGRDGRAERQPRLLARGPGACTST